MSQRPAASSVNARNTMRATRSTSRREVAFRKALWSAGARGYRVHPRLPGRPDLAFPGIKLAVFVHGCFWHRCPTCSPNEPRANADFWREKFASNAERDAAALDALASLGWDSLVIWEHEIRPDPTPRAAQLADSVWQRRVDSPHPRRR